MTKKYVHLNGKKIEVELEIRLRASDDPDKEHVWQYLPEFGLWPRYTKNGRICRGAPIYHPKDFRALDKKGLQSAKKRFLTKN